MHWKIDFKKGKNIKTHQSKKKMEKKRKRKKSQMGWKSLEREHAHLRGGSVVET